MKGSPGSPEPKAEIKKCLVTLWNRLKKEKLISHSVDTIPYTDDFELVFSRVSAKFAVTRREVFVMLVNLRKKALCKSPYGRKKPPRARGRVSS